MVFLQKSNVNEDALFLDINMPDLNGMDFIKSLPHPPAVIFTTAYSEYAVEGFRVNAVDYLLKPFSFKEFEASRTSVRLDNDKIIPVGELYRPEFGKYLASLGNS